MKVGIIRGNNLNKFEMQSYEPLIGRYEITGYASSNNNFDTGDLKFPVRRFHIPEEYYGRAPWPLNSIAYGALLPFGFNYHMIGLEKDLADKDILHTAETYTGYSYQAARMKCRRDKKLVLSVWENVPFMSVHKFRGLSSNEKIVRYVRDNADLFIAVTERARTALQIEGVSEDRIRVVPAGVDTDRFKPAAGPSILQSSLGLSPGDFAVLFTGRLSREKGIYDLLYAAKLISRDPELRHVKIIIAGNGPEKANMARMMKSLSIDHIITMAGVFSYAEMPALFNAADVFILPSIPVHWWQEQFGMVLVEAMASGLPVISTLSGSIAEVVGDAGALIQPGDPLSIYREVKHIALDQGYRTELGKKGRTRAMELFNITRVSSMLDSVYKELI